MAKKTVLEKLSEQINKEIGDGSIVSLANVPTLSCDVLPTGIKKIDDATGIGGIPKGRITEIFGSEACGKTTLCLHVAREAQKRNEAVAIIDAEHALSEERLNALTIDRSLTLLSQPNNGEHAFDVLEYVLMSKKVSLIIVDSVAALTPKIELEKDFGSATMGAHARLIGQAMRKLVANIHTMNTAVIFTNQVRAKISGILQEFVPTGGNALKFYASLRIKLFRIGAIVNEEGNKLSSRYRLSIVKNKLAAPYKEIEYVVKKTGIVPVDEDVV